MPSKTSRDFQKAAGQRHTAAEGLFQLGFNLDAQYLGGYTVECSLKALIMHRTPDGDKETQFAKISSGAAMHQADNLAKILRDLGVTIPLPLQKRLRRFTASWATNMRYEYGRRDTGETKAFLDTVKLTHDWVEGELA